MLVTSNYKKYNLYFNLLNNYKNYNLLGYTDNILLTNKGFLKAPNLLFDHNMCLFLNLDKNLKLNVNYNIISYKGYLITNICMLKQELTKQNYLSLKINSFVWLILVNNIHNILLTVNNILCILLTVVIKYLN